MSVSSVSITRVTENLKASSLLETLRQNTLKLFEGEEQMATGYKVVMPSDDPVGASKVIQLNQLLEQQDQILANLGLADSFLSATDDAISDLNSLLIDAQEIANEHVGNITDAEQRESAAVVVDSIIDQLVMIGNRTHQGRYLFAGRQVDEAPFTREDGYVKFVGDTGSLLTRVDEVQEEAYNLTGDALFGAISEEMACWSDWDALLTEQTRLRDCGGVTGRGITLGTVEINETGVVSFQVDLTQADSVGDVIDLIDQAAADAGSSVTASINAAGNGIGLTTGGSTLEVTESGEGMTARDLGMLTTGPLASVTGEDIQPAVTGWTQLQDLGGVALADLSAGFVINNGGRSGVINTSVLTGTDTVQDLLNLINTAELNVWAKLSDDGTGIDIVNRLSGCAMTIGENGGNTAEALGIRSMHAGTSLSALNRGQGVSGTAGRTDFRIVARDGSSFEVDINDADGGLDRNGDGFETLEDVLFAINEAAAAAGVGVSAGMAVDGNGIRLVDTTGVDGTLRVERMNLSYAVDDLGLTGLEASGAGASVEVVGEDVNGIRAPGVFTALHDLHEALLSGDQGEISAAGAQVEEMIAWVNRSLGEVGSRSSALSARLSRTEEAVDATRKALSEVRDLDYAEAITRFQQAQTALQANLMAGSQTLSLSLLDFLE